MTESAIDLPTILDGEDKQSPLKNCIRNKYRHLRKWAKRTNTNCFRLYDRELHHYPLAIDLYGNRYCIHYFCPNRSEDEIPLALQEEITTLLRELLGAKPEEIYWRTRIKRKKTEQYEKNNALDESFTVFEYGLKFKVNLIDYLDTGLFLDHRETRKMIGSLAKGKRVLNLFAYTCAFSIHAAAGGALMTKSVDMSNTYTAWGRENFNLNGFDEKNHPIVRDDCLKFLIDEVKRRQTYDLIILDPPTISRSKKMDQMFDVQIDYVYLFQQIKRLLSDDGALYFSTNSRRFILDESLFPDLMIKEISEKTLPQDFSDRLIHRCWKVTKSVDKNNNDLK